MDPFAFLPWTWMGPTPVVFHPSSRGLDTENASGGARPNAGLTFQVGLPASLNSDSLRFKTLDLSKQSCQSNCPVCRGKER
jgi:hypothetical protein